MPGKMGNCVSDSFHKYMEADDEKIIICDSSSEAQGLMEKNSNAKYVSNGDDINSKSTSHTDDMNGGSRRRSNQQFMSGSVSSEVESIIFMHNSKFSHVGRKPSKLAKSNFRSNIAAPSHEQRASGRSVHLLKVVISAKELRELLINSQSAEHNSREAALASLVLEKISETRGNGGLVMMNSASKATKTVQGEGNNNNNRSWRPSLEDIPELFKEE